MERLSHQRCFNHLAREAVAKCPGCARFYCRECITEHDDRVLCADCMRELGAELAHGKRRFQFPMRVVQFIGAILLGWLFFYFMGQILVSLDPAFHEGTVWKERWWPQY